MIATILQQQPPQAGDGIYTEESFRFLALPELWQVALVIVPLVALFSWWTYGGLDRMPKRTRVVLATLRGLAIAVLLFALFQPAIEQVRYTTVQTQVYVLVDDSASMQRKDTYPEGDQRASLARASGVEGVDGLTRSELVAKVIGRPGGLLDTLGQQHDVRLFRFSREPRVIRDLGELSAKGPRTHIGDAMDLLRSSAAAAGLDALILVSDGRNNGGLPPDEVAESYRTNDVPIYSIGVGDPNPPHNVRIIGPPGPQEALRREEIAFEVTVSSEGMAGRSVPVTLYGAREGEPYVPLATATTILAEDGVPTKVRLYHAFEDAGDYSLRFETPTFPEETSQEDNRDTRFLRVNDQKIRVLYLENVPRWEYRYVWRALDRVDPSIEFQAYLFDAAHDFPQESSEELQSLRDIPKTREALQQYHVILLGDVPPEKLGATEEQRNEWLKLLVEFVELGGGAGFMFGPQAMPERYRGTPLEDLLPVVLEDPLVLNRLDLDRTAEFMPQLESPQHPHDIALLMRDPQGNADRWQNKLAPLKYYYPVQKAKAGAEVVLVHPTDRTQYGPRPIAVATEYPRGRTFFIATDETWRWRKPYGERYQDNFWRNAVRYLAAGRLRRRDDRVELRVDKVIVEAGEQVGVHLDVRDDEFQPSQAEEFAVFLRRPEGQPERRMLRATPGDPGSYQGSFTMDQPGSVSILVAQDDNPAGEVLAREDVLVKIPDREMAQSSQDRETLEKIAAHSKGGRYVFLGDADQLLADFKENKPYEHKVDSSTRPLWDQFWVLVVVLAILGLEWALRKRARLV
jgi:uncharacterized membrane protein